MVYRNLPVRPSICPSVSLTGESILIKLYTNAVYHLWMFWMGSFFLVDSQFLFFYANYILVMYLLAFKWTVGRMFLDN